MCLLVLTFVGGAELAACYWLDPPVFHKVVDPVVEKAEGLWHAGREQVRSIACGMQDKIAERIALRQQKIIQEQQEQIESQQAGEPAILGGGIDITDPAVTELVMRDGQEILTGGSVSICYFAQSDPAWKDKPYGTDRVGPYGCGPTALAMAVRSLTDTPTDPAAMAEWCSENGFWAAQSGSYHTIVRGVASAFGLECTSLSSMTPESLRMELSGGRIAVALMSRGHFTSTGHFILLRGVTLEGNILVADPNSRQRSLQEWDASLILNELSNSSTAGAPLWLLSQPAVE